MGGNCKRFVGARFRGDSSSASFGGVWSAGRVSVGSSQAVLYRLAGEWACLASACSKCVNFRAKWHAHKQVLGDVCIV